MSPRLGPSYCLAIKLAKASFIAQINTRNIKEMLAPPLYIPSCIVAAHSLYQLSWEQLLNSRHTSPWTSWQHKEEERKNYPELVAWSDNPWTVLQANSEMQNLKIKNSFTSSAQYMMNLHSKKATAAGGQQYLLQAPVLKCQRGIAV